MGSAVVPVSTRNVVLSPGEIELAKDFDYIYKLCCLVESSAGTLPRRGGWEDQSDEFVTCWLIYQQEKSKREAAELRGLYGSHKTSLVRGGG